jgi:hypothetical protein
MCWNACWSGWGVCTCRHSDAQVSKGSESEGFRERKSSTLWTALSPLFIEVEGCRAIEEAHLALAVTKSWEV